MAGEHQASLPRRFVTQQRKFAYRVWCAVPFVQSPGATMDVGASFFGVEAESQIVSDDLWEHMRITAIAGKTQPLNFVQKLVLTNPYATSGSATAVIMPQVTALKFSQFRHVRSIIQHIGRDVFCSQSARKFRKCSKSFARKVLEKVQSVSISANFDFTCSMPCVSKSDFRQKSLWSRQYS